MTLIKNPLFYYDYLTVTWKPGVCGFDFMTSKNYFCSLRTKFDELQGRKSRFLCDSENIELDNTVSKYFYDENNKSLSEEVGQKSWPTFRVHCFRGSYSFYQLQISGRAATEFLGYVFSGQIQLDKELVHISRIDVKLCFQSTLEKREQTQAILDFQQKQTIFEQVTGSARPVTLLRNKEDENRITVYVNDRQNSEFVRADLYGTRGNTFEFEFKKQKGRQFSDFLFKKDADGFFLLTAALVSQSLDFITISDFTCFLAQFQTDLKKLLRTNSGTFAKFGQRVTEVALTEQTLCFLASPPPELQKRKRKQQLSDLESQNLEKLFKTDLSLVFVLYPHFFQVTQNLQNSRQCLILLFLVQKFLNHLQKNYSINQCIDFLHSQRTLDSVKNSRPIETIPITFLLAELADFLQVKPRAENLEKIYAELQKLSAVLLKHKFLQDCVEVEVSQPFILNYTKLTSKGRGFKTIVNLELSKLLLLCCDDGFVFYDLKFLTTSFSNVQSCCKNLKTDFMVWSCFLLFHLLALGETTITSQQFQCLPKNFQSRLIAANFLEQFLQENISPSFGLYFTFSKNFLQPGRPEKTSGAFFSILVSGPKTKIKTLSYKKSGKILQPKSPPKIF